MKYLVILVEPNRVIGLLKSITIEGVNTNAVNDYMIKNYPKTKFFIIDNDNKLFITYMKNNISFLSPTELNVGKNWSCLLPVLKNEGYLETILNDYISVNNNTSHLLEWIKIIQSYKFNTAEYNFILHRIETLCIKTNTIVQDMSNVILKEAKKSLEPDNSFRGKEKLLTPVDLKPALCSEVIISLGKKFELDKMMSSSKLENDVKALSIHETIIKYLQSIGFPKIGDKNQEYLTQNNSSKWSKKGISKYYEKIDKKVLSTLLQPNIDNFEVLTLINLLNKNSLELNEVQQLLKLLSDSLLSKNEYVKLVGAKDYLLSKTEDMQMKLDKWQKEMIDHIQHGRSIIVNGPTSGGKTLAAMASINGLINQNNKVKLLYCAPLDHLCIQAWVNISKTFKQKVALICGVFSYIPEDATIWIGTPIELNSYFVSIPTLFDIGIFDEIHSISTSFGEGMTNIIRAEAIAMLLKTITKQMVAISATIHAIDIPKLKQFIITETKISDIQEIVYTERPVPTTSYIWNNSISEIKNFNEVPLHPITPVSTFDLLLQLRNKDILPAIIFDESEQHCFEQYTKYVEWLENKESTEYREWTNIRNNLGYKIDSLNSDMKAYENEWSEAQCKSENVRKFMYPRIRGFISKRNILLKEIRSCLLNSINKHKTDKSDYMITLKESEKSKFVNIGITDDKVPSLIYYLYQQITYFPDSQLTEESPDALTPIKMVCEGKAPFYRIGNNIIEAELFRSMYDSGKCQGEALKVRKRMLELCQAERIREEEIRPLFNLISRGLDYGVGIILPTMPFVVQYLVLQLLNDRKIKVVFASQSMSMGINFPIRTVVIRSELGSDVNVSEIMQMSGRAGRRGMDTHGYTIFWNITNSIYASLETLPFISLPNINLDSGSLIKNHIQCAIDIECERVNINDTSMIDEALDKLAIEIKISKYIDNEDNDDDSNIEAIDDGAIDEYKPTISKDKTVKSNVVDQGLSASIIGCIGPVMKELNMDAIAIIEVTQRIQEITLGQYSNDIKEDAYYWAQVINTIKRSLQEIHTRIRILPNVKLTKYIASVYELLHRIQYRQMRM